MNLQPLNMPAPEALNLLKSRRSGSAKAMTGPGPSAAQIRELITCASRVPDHGKLTPWRFITFTGEGRAKIGEQFAARWKVLHPEHGDEILAFMRALDVNEIHGYRPELGLRVFTPEALADLTQKNKAAKSG